MENAEITKEIDIQRPTFDGNINVTIPEISEVKHNLNVLEDFAKNLKEYYGKLVFSDESSKEAEEERKKLNALIKDVENIRKEKVAEYKKPIDDFEQTAKRIEKTLKEAKDSVQVFIDKAEEKRRKDKHDKVIEPIINTLINNAFVNGYLIDKEKIIIDNRWYNKTFKDAEIEKDINSQISEIIRQEDEYNKGLEIIKSTIEMASQMSIEKDFDKYKERFTYTRDLTSILEDIKYENIAREKVTTVSRTVDNNTLAVQPNDLSMFDDSSFNIQDVVAEYTIRVRGTVNQLAQLRTFIESIGMEEI